MRHNSLLGRTLANFKVERLIGRGGMAEVYYGMDVKLHRPVAIKVFDSASRANASQTQRFLQEARMMAQWRHNHIVQIYYADDATGLSFYVMEFVDGYDLASIMSVYAEKGELMPFADVLRIGDALASALDYAHEQGVIHRDVKPANVMIATSDGRVVLGDFGLALNISDKSQGEVFGSPHYISPEQARRSSDAVPQSDLYSLGVILYEMLTGATPFNDPSPASLALQHITEPPPLPRSVNPALSVEIENVLLKALEKDPADRYQTGRELMAALRGALAEKPALVPEASSLPPIPVGAPTVQRSGMSLNSFTKRGDVVAELKKRTTSRHDFDAVVPAPVKPFKWGGLLMLLLVLLAAAVLAWRFYPPFAVMLAPPAPTSALPIVSTEPFEPVAQTQLPAPSLTETDAPPTATPSLTPSPIPTATLTASLTVTPTETVPPSPTIVPTATVKYPDGYWMTAFYNESSFYILNRDGASRSVAGFSFERIHTDGSFVNYFGGWEWERFFKVIQPNRCISLELYPVTVPYLKPAECENRILSNLRFAPTGGTVFWTPNETSVEFRVMWLNEEIARCEIEAGACDFYVP